MGLRPLHALGADRLLLQTLKYPLELDTQKTQRCFAYLVLRQRGRNEKLI